MEGITNHEECKICYEKFNSTGRKKVVCPFCHIDSCSKCFQTYLLTSVNLQHCFSCKKEFSNEFVAKNSTKSFFNSEYRKHTQKLWLDIEKSKLQDSMEMAEKYKFKKNLLEKTRVLKEKRDKIVEKLNIIDQTLLMMKRTASQNYKEINIQEYLSMDSKNKEKQKEPSETESYTIHCPLGDCRGFIKSKSWKCGVCDQKICSKCHRESTDDHTCKEDDITSALMIMKETKPCPNCNTRIFKDMGCNVMFCTFCKTGFDWKTLEIIKKNIHNPHYFDYMRTLGRDPTDNMPQNPCEVAYFALFDKIASLQLPNKVQDHIELLYRRVGEVRDLFIYTYRIEEDFSTDLRVKYIVGEYDEKKFKTEIFRRQRKAEKKLIIRQILETFVMVMNERFRTILDEVQDSNGFWKILDEMNTILNLTNEYLRDNIIVLGYSRFPQIDLEFGHIICSDIITSTVGSNSKVLFLGDDKERKLKKSKKSNQLETDEIYISSDEPIETSDSKDQDSKEEEHPKEERKEKNSSWDDESIETEEDKDIERKDSDRIRRLKIENILKMLSKSKRRSDDTDG